MLNKMTIKVKLITVFSVALLGILVLSVSGNLALKKNMEVGRIVKEEKFTKAIAIEKIASSGQAMISQIDFSASSGTDAGLIKATKEKEGLVAQLKKVKSLTQDEALIKKFDQLAKMTNEVYASGAKKVQLMIDQDFTDLAKATKEFDTWSKKYAGLISQLQRLAREDLESSLDEMASMSGRSANLGWIVTLIVLPVVLFSSVFVYRSISGPIKHLEEVMGGLAGGDLTIRSHIQTEDEMGHLSASINSFLEKLGEDIRQIATASDQLSQASSNLSGISSQMSSGADDVSSRSNTVAAAAEEMSANMTSVAAAAEQAATNVGMVAAAAEEMTATINEIAQNSEKARSVTGEAVSQAKSASDRVDELGRAAEEIDKVTETINEISEQTNLAGEAGKGFAVVANEIKELARQTATATEEIKKEIEGIQGSTADTVTEIGQISQVINEVNEIVSTIAAAVEEQSVTTKEIANNVAQASSGIQEVNEKVAQSSTVSGEIAKDISGVNQAAGDMSNSSSQVNLSAEDLSKLAQQLKEMVGKFKV
ncbi:MAG: methyl-accepting chemotaxis protein [Deltaproteobacteria bacterium]|nr:methyl-accepting chemotaxis protein [Deltaproteobacteria bacterium]